MLFQGLAYIPIHCNSYSSNSQNVVGTSENPPNLLRESLQPFFTLIFHSHSLAFPRGLHIYDVTPDEHRSRYEKSSCLLLSQTLTTLAKNVKQWQFYCLIFLKNIYVNTVVVKSLSHVRLFETPWTIAQKASLSFTMSRSLLRLVSIEWMMLSNYLALCRPPLLLPSIFATVKVFSNESALCWSIGASASASVLAMNIQGSFPLGLTGLFSLQSKGLSRVFSSPTIWKHQFFGTQHTH